MRCSRHVVLKWSPKVDSGHAAEIMSLGWPGNTPWVPVDESCRRWLGKGSAGLHCLSRCPATHPWISGRKSMVDGLILRSWGPSAKYYSSSGSSVLFCGMLQFRIKTCPSYLSFWAAGDVMVLAHFIISISIRIGVVMVLHIFLVYDRCRNIVCLQLYSANVNVWCQELHCQ